ncbi:YbaB/EbfC DNA-binding family protein [Herbihabitans rhizosphaerae]|uniref:YbaB/EbfC DNA-binding family protein n=1 Tax=Herbihabitans rhizosphaerae TaxID=1872711 RepID=A0A4Q7KMP9_9PSEU|nr:YbaB/EbfC family nucleoid-associated protein [Herbihabitans rhizosphaerae]RZS37586.1 YbaB/EbfC DNA-binding family protein [Herbihabitans rhizosphaerae]
MAMEDPEAWVERYAREAEERLTRMQGVKEQLGNTSGTAQSTNGEVSVTVGPGGNLLNIEFSSKVKNIAPTELAQLVLRTAQTAHHNAGQEMLAVMRPEFGQNSEAMSFLESQVAAPAPQEEPNTFAPRQWDEDDPQRPRRPRPGADPDDDEGFGPIMR